MNSPSSSHAWVLTPPRSLRLPGQSQTYHPYRPGLVGGHCIPVDLYFLVCKAKKLGYHPPVILAGRSVKDSMPGRVARMEIMELNEVGKVIRGSKIFIIFGKPFWQSLNKLLKKGMDM